MKSRQNSEVQQFSVFYVKTCNPDTDIIPAEGFLLWQRQQKQKPTKCDKMNTTPFPIFDFFLREHHKPSGFHQAPHGAKLSFETEITGFGSLLRKGRFAEQSVPRVFQHRGNLSPFPSAPFRRRFRYLLPVPFPCQSRYLRHDPLRTWRRGPYLRRRRWSRSRRLRMS